MGEQKTVDVSGIRLESLACPTAADRALWESLSPEQRRAVIGRELDAAEASGPAQSGSMEDVIARVRARKT